MPAAKRPAVVNILGINHQIVYVDKPSEVDIFKRQSLWGQFDPWTRTVRIYDNGRTDEDVWQTLLHEILHSVGSNLHLKSLSGEENHEELDILALALTDILFRNNWIEFENPSPEKK